MNKQLYLSYDMSFAGDFNNLYQWLDAHDAMECGDNFCRLSFPYSGELDCKESVMSFLDALKTDMTSHITFSGNDRIYVLFPSTMKGSPDMVGTFLIGQRHDAPWTGRAKKTNLELQID